MDLLDDERLIDLRPRARRTDAAAVVDEERRRAAPLPAANEALRGWDGAAPESAATARAGAGEGANLCAVCGVKPARSACRSCGRGACTADLWAMLGLCKSCVSPGRAEA